MFSRKHTLTRSDFNKLIKTGSVYKSRLFYLRISNNKLGSVRIGVGISSRLTKTAVERNHYKRLIKHALFDAILELNIGYDIVVLSTENIKNKKLEELSKDLKKLLGSAGLMNKN